MNRNDVSKTVLIKVMADAAGCMLENSGYSSTCTALQKAGFKMLGGGNYGSGWMHPEIPGWAIKVSGRNEGDSFPAYVYWCMANPMPHLPEYQFPVFNQDHSQFMVLMPRYSSIEDELAFNKNPELSSEFREMREVLLGWSTPKPGKNYELQFAAKQVGDFFRNKASFDMHSGNVMMDPLTGRMIITDPIHQGDTDSLITQITGGTYSQKPQVEHQLQLALVDLSSRPGKLAHGKDSFVEWRDIRDGRGLGSLPQIGRVPAFNKMNISWRAVDNLFIPDLGMLAAPGLPNYGFKTPPVGIAAEFIKNHGIAGKTAHKLGELCQQWDEQRLANHHGDIFFCLCPETPAFIQENIGVQMNDVVNVREIRLPVWVVRVLRDEWKQLHNRPMPRNKFNPSPWRPHV